MNSYPVPLVTSFKSLVPHSFYSITSGTPRKSNTFTSLDSPCFSSRPQPFYSVATLAFFCAVKIFWIKVQCPGISPFAISTAMLLMIRFFVANSTAQSKSLVNPTAKESLSLHYRDTLAFCQHRVIIPVV